MINKTWLHVSMVNLILAGIAGVLLRYVFVSEVPGLVYKNVLHAHSHVAMLGWIYLALFNVLIWLFLNSSARDIQYHRLFWLTQISVVGMLLSFPFQGYGPISIFFSTLHLVLSYIFCYFFFRDLKQETAKMSISKLWVQTAFLLMLLSTLGLWLLGPISAMGGKKPILFYMAIQFFLHFQFNGWFLFAVIALFFRVLENRNIEVDSKMNQKFYGLLLLATFLTYALSVSWASPLSLVFWFNSLGVVIQLLGAGIFVYFLLKNQLRIRAIFSHNWAYNLMILALIGFSLKVLIQAVVVIPYLAKVSYTIRNFIIGFIHLINLGIFTSFLLALAIQYEGLSMKRKIASIGLNLFIICILGTEFLLSLQGFMLWQTWGFMPFYYEILFILSAGLPLGVTFLLVGQPRDSPTKLSNLNVQADKSQQIL